MVKTGFEKLRNNIPAQLISKRVGIVCHAPSIGSDYEHITDFVHQSDKLQLGAIFGPQHGLFGQTQDNMIEWEGNFHKRYKVNIYSLYGANRKPTVEMLKGLDALLVDLQDVGARPYTYVWTMRLCMEAAGEMGIPVWILDRPNPVSAIGYDGAVLKKEFFTFVGMASIPLCHRMTIGEIAIWLKDIEGVNCNLNVISMDGYDRDMMYGDTGLPWVLPSPNMPTQASAVVYPGMVLTEATNLSEARGTTIPFELFGAPWLRTEKFLEYLKEHAPEGCSFRIHNYIPTFHKYVNEDCNGIQLHVTDIRKFRPVYTAMAIYEALLNTSDNNFAFLDPPYEYENRLIPFDILSGDDISRNVLLSDNSLLTERERWDMEIMEFLRIFNEIKIY